MDRTVLLLLLCLQAFLLITAFTSADAVTLVEGVSVHDREKGRQKDKPKASNCSWRPGACSPFAKIPPTTPRLSVLDKLMSTKEITSIIVDQEKGEQTRREN